MGRLPNGPGPRAIVVDPNQPMRVYAASQDGVYRSDDAGQSWTPANEGLEGRQVASLALDSSRSPRLFALAQDGTVYFSQDGASTWHASLGR